MMHHMSTEYIDVRQHTRHREADHPRQRLAVGLTELLSEAGVPKGSFYHYFQSRSCLAKCPVDSYFSIITRASMNA